MSVEGVDKDKDADENVDADQVSTGRPVSGQPIGVSTKLEEIDIDFKVSGLPRAVVKQAENFRVRELVKKIESHPHREALQANVLTDCDWVLSQFRTTSSRRIDPMVLDTEKLKHRKSILWPTMRGRDVSKRIMKEFTIVSYEVQFFVTRNSKLAGPRRSASQWRNWHRKTTPTAYPMRNT